MTLNLAYMGFLWHIIMESEIENLVGNLRGNKIFKNSERKNNSEFEKVGRQTSVNGNHTDLIINWNQKYCKLIHVDLNHTKSIQPIPATLKKIGSIHDSANICAIEKILASPVHSPVPDSPIILYGSTSDPPSPFHDSSAEIVTPKAIPNPRYNPLNLLLRVPADPDSDPFFQILLRQSHLTHHTTSIINEDNE